MMSLALKTWIACGVLLWVSASRASFEASTQVRDYDDSQTRVFSPSIDVSGTYRHETLRVNAGFAEDILTSASADVRTWGSRGQSSQIYEQRKQENVGVDASIPDGSVGINYIQSDEHDYHSKIFAASGTRELFSKNTVMGLTFSNGQDTINSSTDPTFDQSMQHQVYSFSVSQILDRNRLIQFVYDLRIENGYLGSPYRRAKFDQGISVSGVPENPPQTRNRNAIAVKYNWYLPHFRLSTSSGYRYYNDSWAVQSHTIEERFTREINRVLSISLNARFYSQTAASFYQDYYVGSLPPFYTGNPTLANYQTYLIGIRPDWAINDHYSLFLKYEYYWEDFFNASDAGVISTRADDQPLKIWAQVYGLGLTAKF